VIARRTGGSAEPTQPRCAVWFLIVLLVLLFVVLALRAHFVEGRPLWPRRGRSGGRGRRSP
jgi:hypothetical protein